VGHGEIHVRSITGVIDVEQVIGEQPPREGLALRDPMRPIRLVGKLRSAHEIVPLIPRGA
jgi:hypothetical protein